MKRTFLVSFFIFVLSVLFVSADDKFVLVIDPGHGGKDAGAVRGKYREKDVNLGVALALGRLVESNMKGVKVVYTRKNDRFVDLYKRAEIANKAKANLFVSIHTNSTASRSTSAQGADTYILGLARSEENLAVAKRENSVILLEDNYNKRYEGFDPNSPESYIIFEFMTDKYMEQSLQFASLVQKGFTNVAKRKDRGVRQAGFLVLRESAMPSVLIELGFINNLEEARHLSTSTGQRSMASAIYSGLKKYIEEFNKRQGQTSVGVSPGVTKKTASSPSTNTVETKGNETVSPQKSTAVPSTPSQSQEIRVSKVETEPSDISKNAQSPVNKTSTLAVEEVPVTDRKKDMEQSKSSSVVASEIIEYRVQFLISQKKLPKNSPQFKGLSPVNEYQDGGIFKYTYGSTADEEEALRIRDQVRKKFSDAFLVKFKNGARIK